MTMKQTYQRTQPKSVKDFFNSNIKEKQQTEENFFTKLMKLKTVSA